MRREDGFVDTGCSVDWVKAWIEDIACLKPPVPAGRKVVFMTLCPQDRSGVTFPHLGFFVDFFLFF